MKAKWWFFEPPPGDINELKSVVFAEEFIVAKYVDVSVFLHTIEHFLGYEFFQVCDGRLRRKANELPLERFEVFSSTLQPNVDLFIKPVEVGFQLVLRFLVFDFVVRLDDILGASEPPLFVELPFSFHLVLLQVGHQLVDNVLHRPVETDVLEWIGLVYDYIARRARIVLFEVLNDARLTEGVQTFRHRRRVDQVALADLTSNVTVERL